MTPPPDASDPARVADEDATATVETGATGGTTLSRPQTHPVDALVSHEETIANGVRLHYVEGGPANGPLALLLHGFPDYWYTWRDQLPALVDAGFRVVAPDMRGYNRSEKPHGIAAYQLERLSRDVAGLIRACGEDRAAVVGHDWGGAVAWQTAMDHPEVVDRLVVSNAPHPVEYCRELGPEQALRSWYGLLFQAPWLPETLLRAGDFRAIERLFREGTTRPDAFTDTDLERFETALSRPGALESALNYYRAFARTTLREHLPGALPIVGERLVDRVDPIEVPTQVLWGERDPALSTDRLAGLDRYAVDLRRRRFPDAGHWVHVDRPERVNESLVRFLTEG